MRADSDYRSRSVQRNRANWLACTLLAIAAIACLTVLYYLHSVGWGVTIDIRKLGDAFTVNKPQAEQQPSSTDLSSRLTNIEYRDQARPLAKSSEPDYIHPRGMRPINYDVHLKLFNSIFIRHPKCNPQKMVWTQVECSNFRARAMKRFGQEWMSNSYWDGSNVVKNQEADKRVNSEITL